MFAVKLTKRMTFSNYRFRHKCAVIETGGRKGHNHTLSLVDIRTVNTYDCQQPV